MPDPKLLQKMAASGGKNRLKFACDGGILSNECTPNNHALDNADSNSATSSDSESCHSRPINNIGVSLQLFTDSLVRMEQAEAEMMRVRESLRWEAEKRRMEMESEVAQMMLATQLQIASLVAKKGLSRKRKRIEGNQIEPSISRRSLIKVLAALQFQLFTI